MESALHCIHSVTNDLGVEDLGRIRAKARERLSLASARENAAEAHFRQDPNALDELIAVKAEVDQALAEFVKASDAYLEALRRARCH
jgi:hypothetical protein